MSTVTTPYIDLVAPFMLSGIGMALFFAPVANVVLSSVRPEHEGKASGATNAIRELGGVFGVAVLAVGVRAAPAATARRETFVHGTDDRRLHRRRARRGRRGRGGADQGPPRAPGERAETA